MVDIDLVQRNARSSGVSDAAGDRVDDDDDDALIWAASSSADLGRMAELARRVFGATTAAIICSNNVSRARSVADTTKADASLFFVPFQSDGEMPAPEPGFASISAPLRLAGGRDIGRVEVIARTPRTWGTADRQLLDGLAADFTAQIELRRELTQRRETEEAYTSSRAQLLAVADRIPGLVFERRKLDAARSLYTFFGASKAKLPAVRQMMENGVAGLGFVHRDDRETVRTAILSSNLEETDLDLTFRIKDLDRTIRWVRSQSIIRREADGTVCWDGLCFDITDLVAAREDAESARKSREELLLAVSRKLRDPLQAIVSLAQLAKVDESRDGILWQARNIEIATQSMIATVDALLAQAGDVQAGDVQAGEALADEAEPRASLDAAHDDARIAHKRPSAPAKAMEDRSHEGDGMRILLADDLDLNRKLIADLLTYEGHEVDCVADGAAAVSAARRNTYDLILMDMIMPGMDGVTATRAIRALPGAAAGVPIVALTANAGKDQLDSCLEAGMNAALTKPMSMDALAAVVTTWTRDRKAA